jgi:hypothetical protein
MEVYMAVYDAEYYAKAASYVPVERIPDGATLKKAASGKRPLFKSQAKASLAQIQKDAVEQNKPLAVILNEKIKDACKQVQSQNSRVCGEGHKKLDEISHAFRLLKTDPKVITDLIKLGYEAETSADSVAYIELLSNIAVNASKDVATQLGKAYKRQLTKLNAVALLNKEFKDFARIATQLAQLPKENIQEILSQLSQAQIADLEELLPNNKDLEPLAFQIALKFCDDKKLTSLLKKEINPFSKSTIQRTVIMESIEEKFILEAITKFKNLSPHDQKEFLKILNNEITQYTNSAESSKRDPIRKEEAQCKIAICTALLGKLELSGQKPGLGLE